MKNILVLLTCFNRKEKTEKCILSLVKENPKCEFSFVIADDNSSDGTCELLQTMRKELNITVLNGNGGLFYSGGMRFAMQYAKKNLNEEYDYVLLINDDVIWKEGCIEAIVDQSIQMKDAIVVGAMQDDAGNQSYGAIKYTKGTKYRKLGIHESAMEADTFNANCVLIPVSAFLNTPIMDEHYIHSLGDFDYGLALKRCGWKIYSSECYVGVCNTNSNKGTWTDNKLSIVQRIHLKESVKGAPMKQWFYFLKKNFGMLTAIKGSITPYLRIVLGR